MFHQQACAFGCCLQGSHLLVVVVGFLAGSLVLHQCLVHFHACVQQGLFETKAGFLLLGFRYFQLGDVRSFIKQRLRQGSHGGGQELTRVDNHAPCTVGPSCTAAQRDGRIESGTGGIRGIESLCQRKFCATHVRTVGKHL